MTCIPCTSTALDENSLQLGMYIFVHSGPSVTELEVGNTQLPSNDGNLGSAKKKAAHPCFLPEMPPMLAFSFSSSVIYGKANLTALIISLCLR